MKILKKIGLGIVALIAIVLFAGLFISRDFSFEKSITINAPIDAVWENTNSLADLDRWSPWADYDPNQKHELFGTDGTVGAKKTWDSEVENVGKGSQTIVKMEAPTLFETFLSFEKPFKSEAKGFVKLKPDGSDKTIVSWSFESEMPYPMNIMKLFMNMDESIGKDFNIGLSKLKKLCEG